MSAPPPPSTAIDLEPSRPPPPSAAPAAAAGHGGLAALFSPASSAADDYVYLEQPDPDRKATEAADPAGVNRLVRSVQFFTRGHAIPWRAVALAGVWATIAVLASWLFGRHWSKNKPGACRWWCSPISIDSAVASYVGFALFLLLGFRVNESYSRYMEAVRIWNDEISGTIAAFCTYASMAFNRGLFHERDRERILGLAAAFAVCLKRELRGEKDLRELKSMLSSKDLAEIQATSDMPGHCLYILNTYLVSSCFKDLKLPEPFYTMLMGHLQAMAGQQGKCMRIRTYKIVGLMCWSNLDFLSLHERVTPAYGYRAHLQVFLVIWFFMLPLALVESSGWYTIPWCMLIALGIIGAEKAADELSDPFGYDYNDIRLSIFTAAIQDNVRMIYKKSLSGSLSRPTDTPDMLDPIMDEGTGKVPARQ